MSPFPKLLITAVLGASALTACSQDRYGNTHLDSTGRGAAIGAAGGAVIGAIAGDPLAGAAIGAAGGAIIGAANDDNRYEDRGGRRYYYDRRDRDRRYHYENDRRVYDPYN